MPRSEDAAHQQINGALSAAGWVDQDFGAMNPSVGGKISIRRAAAVEDG